MKGAYNFGGMQVGRYQSDVTVLPHALDVDAVSFEVKALRGGGVATASLGHSFILHTGQGDIAQGDEVDVFGLHITALHAQVSQRYDVGLVATDCLCLQCMNMHRSYLQLLPIAQFFR